MWETQGSRVYLAQGELVFQSGRRIFPTTSLGKMYGGERLGDERDRYLALRRCLQSNVSQSAKQKLGQVPGNERRRVKHINHETSKAIVAAAVAAGASTIAIASRQADAQSAPSLGLPAQLETIVEYKARAVGMAVE